MAEKKERGRFTLRFNCGDPIHEIAIDLLELQSPRTKAQYVANAVIYYNEHFSQEPQPLNAPSITREAVEAIVKEILRQEGMELSRMDIPSAACLEDIPVSAAKVAAEPTQDGEAEMDDMTRSLIADTLSAFRSRG